MVMKNMAFVIQGEIADDKDNEEKIADKDDDYYVLSNAGFVAFHFNFNSISI